ncbi:MAG TPA: phenylalanine--tRNA ligase subunit beta, partial [Candidatus Limnocylindria bacterium]|nr:phenylalanine--tRNA ligase subunit beta [Candidatus Limnocylindria bacterium]
MPSLKVPVSWLREYVDVEDVDATAQRLHMAGTEVDRVERTGAWDDKIWVGRIASLEKHPDADKLLLAVVEYGQGRRKTVVTGAMNMKPGDLVPFAEAGATYLDGHTGKPTVLKPKPMRGVPSEGMVMSAKELGLGEDHDGILILDPALQVGAPLRDALGDAVIHCEIAPNRPDVLAIVGVAREVSAVESKRLREPEADPLPARLDQKLLRVRIDDAAGCPRFAAAYLEGVRHGPSPEWMQRRLTLAGMRPISVVVDVTNYVMLELGQPLHAYDADRLAGRALVARRARKGERLRTLDGVDRELDATDLVIADDERALGLAGIMGGEDSEIRETTRTVALECASFEPLGVRRTADRHSLQGSSGSAAARRFGLGLSEELVPLALARAVRLLREHAGATVAGAVDVHPSPRPRGSVRLRFADIPRVLGVDIPREESVAALERLGFAVRAKQDELEVDAPRLRTDVGIAEDVVEEVARIVGYDRIPTRLPSGPLPPHERHPVETFRERLRDLLAGFGLQEIVSYAAIDPAWLERLTGDGSCLTPAPLRIVNPTTVALSVMRPTLRASLYDTAQRNLRHRDGVALFEIAPAYLPRPSDLPEERWTCAILLSGRTEEDGWLAQPRQWDLDDLRGMVLGIHAAMRLSEEGETTTGAPGLHPARSYRIAKGGRDVITVGQVDPRVAERWDLPASTFLAELDVAALAADVDPPRAVTPPRYPPARRDLAIVVDERRAYADVAREIRAAGKGVVESVGLLDLYRGPQV